MFPESSWTKHLLNLNKQSLLSLSILAVCLQVCTRPCVGQTEGSECSLGPRRNLILHFLWARPHSGGQVTKQHESATRVTAVSLDLTQHNRICLPRSQKKRPTAVCVSVESHALFTVHGSDLAKQRRIFSILWWVLKWSCRVAVVFVCQGYNKHIHCSAAVKSCMCTRLETTLTACSFSRVGWIACFVLLAHIYIHFSNWMHTEIQTSLQTSIWSHWVSC